MRNAVVAGSLAILLAACSAAATPAGSGQVSASGFPLGTFAKEIVHPQLGHIRLTWIFDPGGAWAEVPDALDGQPMLGTPVRGTYTVDRETLTIVTSYPPDWGTSVHAWRLDGPALWTSFRSSDIPDDADWFAELDRSPWVRTP